MTADAIKLQKLVEGQIKNEKFKYSNIKKSD